ncbi:MAG: threonylcarbamoyl-AMP synthase [Geodermatophilaceae bacterium]|nr:threonylcarbamoyl-AMP synthase [Geodermatophilaceae bacterium]MDQ3456276.1 L-threonylcarbamoyladenylate synthase [Actinomycetota bacterium]
MSRVFDCTLPDRRRRGIAAAADAIAAGRLVVLPTDTVYGLGADAFAPEAVQRVLQAKGRGREMPVPVLVGSWAGIDGLMTVVPDPVRRLVRAFWPGGLTLVVEHASTLAWDLGDARGTVAVRMPLHPVALELLERTGPLAVSSANVSGQPPATTAEQAQEQLGEAVAVYLAAAPTESTVPSTIVDATATTPRLLRAGAVSLSALRDVVPDIQEIA